MHVSLQLTDDSSIAMSMYSKRVLKEAGKHLLLAVAIVAVFMFIPRGVPIPGWTEFAIVGIIGLNFAWEALPKKIYCADCGNYLGKENESSGCNKCGGNIVSYEQTGAGRTVYNK